MKARQELRANASYTDSCMVPKLSPSIRGNKHAKNVSIKYEEVD